MTNFISLSFTMTLISKSMVRKAREKYKNQKLDILDLKVLQNHQFYTKSIINWFRNNPKPRLYKINKKFLVFLSYQTTKNNEEYVSTTL